MDNKETSGKPLSLAYLREKFDEFNVQMFEGKLPMPRLRIGHSRTMLGNVRYKHIPHLLRHDEYKDFTITISSYYQLEESVLEDTIIHEMIHYFILYNRIKDTSSHGKVFRRMMNDINTRYGRNITVSYRNHGKLILDVPANKQYVVAVSEFPDGSLGVTIPIGGKSTSVERGLFAYFNIKSLRWYNSRDAFFATIPKSRTPKIYKVNQVDLLRALEKAILL